MNEKANRVRPNLTRKQVADRRLQPEGSSTLPDDERSDEASVTETGLSPTRYAALQAKQANLIRNKIGPNWFFDHPIINPVAIIKAAPEQPMSAALVCYQACRLLRKGHHQRVREYLVAAYSVARGFKAHPDQIDMLAQELTDKRSSKPLKQEIVEQDLLRCVFVFIFSQSGLVTRDRANQYAQSLQYYFDRNAEIPEIDELLRTFGQNRLRIAAQRLANISRDRREWVEQGKDSSSVTMEEVLAGMVAEGLRHKLKRPENEPPSPGPSDVAFGDLKAQTEVEDVTDDADWLDENDPDRNSHATDYDEDELEPEEQAAEELIQPPEVDEFFDDMMRLTAQMVVGLGDDKLDKRHRDEMLLLVREIWLKVMLFRGTFD